jgi:hypothetical protein
MLIKTTPLCNMHMGYILTYGHGLHFY